MSTLPDPHQDRPAAEQALTAREEAILADIAGRENASDPGFVARLGSGRVPVDGGAGSAEAEAEEAAAYAHLRDRAVQVLVVVALGALLLPAAWFATAVLVVALLVVPAALVALAWSEQRGGRSGGETGAGAGSDESTGR